MPEITPYIEINADSIRKEWHDEQWYYSIIDLIVVLLNSDYKRARNYYNVLKSNLVKEGNETITKLKQLKLVAQDGKRRLTDVVNTEEALRIIQSIPSPKVEPMKLWLANVGAQRLEETQDPELGLFRSFDRAVEEYRSQGKAEGWIKARIDGIITRNRFVEALKTAILDAPPTIYAEATEKVYRGLWQRTTAQLRGELNIDPKANLRDHFGKYALIYTSLVEEIVSDKLDEAETVTESMGMEIVWGVAKLISIQAKATREALGYDLVTEKPLLSRNDQT